MTATMDKITMLLDYMSTYPNALLRFYKSGMILHIDSDAAYLVLLNACSCYASHFFLSTLTPGHHNPMPNAPIHTECKTICSVVASAAEAETAGIFGNSQTAIIIRRALEALGHLQPPTPLKTDNSTAHDFVHSNIRQKHSKTWDMKYNWLRDREAHKDLHIYWDKGTNNGGDYFTKHHPPAHHRTEHSKYILKGHCATQTFTPLQQLAATAAAFHPYQSDSRCMSVGRKGVLIQRPLDPLTPN